MLTEIAVAKFGGTSLGDSAQVKKFTDIIATDSRIKVVVVSAPGKRLGIKNDMKVTDMLVALHVACQAQQMEEARRCSQLIKARYVEIAEGHFCELFIGKIDGLLQEIVQVLSDQNMNGNDARSYAMSRGGISHGSPHSGKT